MEGEGKIAMGKEQERRWKGGAKKTESWEEIGKEGKRGGGGEVMESC